MSAPEVSAKVAIVGLGMVGSTLAYALMIKGLVRELALLDQDQARAEGEAMDLSHGLAFTAPVSISAGGYELCQGADLVVITAGAPQLPGQTRLDLAQKNAAIIKDMVPKVLAHNSTAVFCLVSNPVDVLTYIWLKESGLPARQVLGSGTSLDTSRLRQRLSEHCGLDTRNIHAYIIGEHGDSELALWSRVNIAGLPLKEYCALCGRGCAPAVWRDMAAEVRGAAYQVIARKKVTNFAVGLAVARIAEAVLRDQRSVLTVSTLVEDCQGVGPLCLSLPCVLGRQGVERVLDPGPDAQEAKALAASAQVLRQALTSLGY